MSAPEARCASAITACDGYLPVPTMSRDEKVRPAMTRGSDTIWASVTANYQLPTTNYELPTFKFPKRADHGRPWKLAVGSWKLTHFDCSSTTHEPHDLHFISLSDHRRRVAVAFDDRQIVFDRDDAGI